MKITVLRGTNHIGGSITEITYDGVRIIIDLGAMLPDSGENVPETNPNIVGLTCGAKNVDAVFFTHIHGDHIGLINYLLPGIPMYLDEYAIRIYRVISKWTKQKTPAFSPLYAGRSVTLGNSGHLTVTPFFTDHSAFRASMFLIEGGGKRILHTGDFRDHGRIGAKLDKMLETYVGKVDALICEGTMMSRANETVLTETELSEQAEQYMKDHKLVVSLQSSTNIDRIASFWTAAKRQHKLFLVDQYQLEILDALDRTPYGWLAKDAELFEFKLMEEIEKCGAFMPMRKSQIKLFCALAPKFEGCLLYSQWEGYKGNDAKVDAMLTEAAEYDYPVIPAHTSGHATISAIQKVVNITQPKVVIPMHTERKNEFSSYFNNTRVLEDGEGAKWKLLNLQKRVDL
jgi:ribonuclease J